MGTRSRLAIVLAAGAGMLAGAAPAAAVSPPGCWNADVWARPGAPRTVELYCPRNEHATVSAAPASSELELLRADGELLQLRLTPTATAPEHESFTLHLSGPAGDADQVVSVTNVPLSRNTAPRCDPVTVAQRTSGTAPVPIELHVVCRDDERDDFTLRGSGPGTHSDAPLHVAGGTGSVSNHFWHYLPTIAAGQEQTAYHAVDALGARSADAPITVALGPGVDRLPSCRPNPGGNGANQPIHTRPGAPRRFALICEDADGDAITPRLVQAPSRGDIVRFEAQPPSLGYWGLQVWVDVVYVPRTPFEGEDPFAIGATGPRGAGPVQDVTMVARALPENFGAGCWLWNPTGSSGEAVTLDAECQDQDGDPIAATISTAPAHGRVTAPAISVGRYGTTKLQAAYTPDPGFTGADIVSVTVSDGGGWSQELDFPLRAGNGIAIFGPMPPDHLARFMANWLPAAATPVEQARSVLKTRSVRLVKRIGEARVYAPRAAPKAASKRSVVAVTCPTRCTVSSKVTVARKARGANPRVLRPGAALGLGLTADQRKRAKRAGGARAEFRLAVKPAGGKLRRATVRVALRG